MLSKSHNKNITDSKLTPEVIFHKIKKLPPLNIIIPRLLEVVRNENSSADDVTKVLSGDQAIAAKVLELVNSSFYGFTGNISTISRAVVILGNKSIQNLALAFASVDFFKGTNPSFDMKNLWLHSISTAAAAQTIASKANYHVPEEAFIAGLLHDMGQLVLGNFIPDRYKIILEKGKETFLKNERRELGFTHCQVGAMLLDHWNLPPILCYSIKEHHSRLSDYTKPEDRLVVIIKLAEIISWILDTPSYEALEEKDLFKKIDTLGISTNEYESIIIESRKLSVAMEDFLNISDISLSEKFHNNLEQEMHPVGVISNSTKRSGWVASLLNSYGFHAIKVPAGNPSGVMKFNPEAVIADTQELERESINNVISFLKENDLKFMVLESDDPDDKNHSNIISGYPVLPLLFKAKEINTLIDVKE